MDSAPRRPVVLIECGDTAATIAQTGAFVDAGFAVRACPGPDAVGEDRCELLRRGRCHLVEGADVVFHDLDLDAAEDRQVLAAIRARYPELPVVVEVPTSGSHGHGHDDLLAGCTVVPPISPERVAFAAQAATELR